jgi:HEAT repeat protein
MITNCTLPMELRSRAAAMVGQSDRPEDRSPEVIPELLKLLDSRDSNLAGGAITGLFNLGAKPETVVPLLIATLQSANENPSLRIQAAAGLGKYGTNAMAAVPALMDLLEPDKTQDQRVAAEAALRRIQPKALPNLDTSSL